MTTREPNPHWIDITQRQPDDEVLALNAADDFLIGYVYKEGDQYTVEAEGITMNRVTHWMDLGELRVLRRLQFPE